MVLADGGLPRQHGLELVEGDEPVCLSMSIPGPEMLVYLKCGPVWRDFKRSEMH